MEIDEDLNLKNHSKRSADSLRNKDEGIDLNSGKDFVTMRPKTIAKIVQKLQNCNVVVIRAPICSGKTSIATLLKKHFQEEKKEELIFFLNMFDVFHDFEESWKEETGYSWSQLFAMKKPIKLILDEIQSCYELESAIPFWNKIKEINESQQNNQFKIIMLEATGTTKSALPFVIPKENCFGCEDLVFCNEEEANALFKSFNAKNYACLDITENISKQLFYLTQGHLGFLKRGLLQLQEIFLDQTPVPEKKILEYLNAKPHFCFRNAMYCTRCALVVNGLNEQQQQFLKDVMKNGDTLLPEGGEERKQIEELLAKGILRKFKKGTDDYVRFMSPLIQQIIDQRY